MLTSAGNSIIIRMKLSRKDNSLSEVLSKITELGGQVGAIDTIKIKNHKVTRDITIDTTGEEHAAKLLDSLEKIAGVEIRHVSDRTFLLHQHR